MTLKRVMNESNYPVEERYEPLITDIRNIASRRELFSAMKRASTENLLKSNIKLVSK